MYDEILQGASTNLATRFSDLENIKPTCAFLVNPSDIVSIFFMNRLFTLYTYYSEVAQLLSGLASAGLLLLLNYHRRLRMITEALKL